MQNQQKPQKFETELALEICTAIARHKPLTYMGTGELVELENWLWEFEKLLIVVLYSEAQKVNQVAFYL